MRKAKPKKKKQNGLLKAREIRRLKNELLSFEDFKGEIVRNCERAERIIKKVTKNRSISAMDLASLSYCFNWLIPQVNKVTADSLKYTLHFVKCARWYKRAAHGKKNSAYNKNTSMPLTASTLSSTS